MLGLFRNTDAFVEAVDEMDLASRQRLTAEIIKLKEAVQLVALTLAFIAFLILRLG